MSRIAFPLLLIALSLGATACRCGESTPEPAPTAEAEDGPLTGIDDTDTAVEAAQGFVDLALAGAGIPDLEALERHFDTAVVAADTPRILLIMESFPRDASRLGTLQMEIRGLQAMGRIADARAALMSAMVLNPEEEGLAEMMAALWASDPEFNREVEVWDVTDNRELTPFHGSSSIIFEFWEGANRMASFKPSQTIRRQYYRSEVAAEILVRVLELGVAVPRSAEVQVGWDEFHELSGIEPGDDSFHETNGELIWLEAGGERFLRGVSKAWVHNLERFPIEYTEAWHQLLDGSHDLAWLDSTSVADAFAGLQGRPRDHYDDVVAAAEHATTFNLAAQLSDLHVFDVLINNYDRYQPEGLQLGMNCHLAGGAILSLDNGAGFPTRDDHDWRRVRSKLEPIQLYSRSTYLNLRSNDPASLREVLFRPSEYADQEDDRYEYFEERWQWMVDHIESLIEEHGEDNVLVFP